MKYNFYYINLILLLLLLIFLIYNFYNNKFFLKNEKFDNSLFLNISPSPTEFNLNGLSPNILKIEKSGNLVTLYLKKNIRDTDILNPKEISVYEIYFKRKDHLNLPCNTPIPSNTLEPVPSPSLEPSYEFDNTFIYEKRNINPSDWNRLVVYCETEKICKVKIEDSYFDTDEEYIFFAIKNNNNRKSSIENLVEVSNTKDFSIYEQNIVPSTTEIYNQDNEKECESYTFKECPTDITGTILSRCHQDKINKKCKTLIFDKTIFDN